MAAKGAIAKADVEQRIIAAFGEDYIGIADKKIYVYGKENGEKVQIAISMTCPKNPFSSDGAPAPAVTSAFELVEPKEVVISEEERANIADLMEKLGL